MADSKHQKRRSWGLRRLSSKTELTEKQLSFNERTTPSSAKGGEASYFLSASDSDYASEDDGQFLPQHCLSSSPDKQNKATVSKSLFQKQMSFKLMSKRLLRRFSRFGSMRSLNDEAAVIHEIEAAENALNAVEIKDHGNNDNDAHNDDAVITIKREMDGSAILSASLATFQTTAGPDTQTEPDAIPGGPSCSIGECCVVQSQGSLNPGRLNSNQSREQLSGGACEAPDDQWEFPLSQVVHRSVIASPGLFSTIEKGEFCGENVCVKCVRGPIEELYAMTEVKLLRSFCHVNVLKLHGSARLLGDEPSVVAVTEWMAGGSLRDAMQADFDSIDKERCELGWPSRLRAALHAARALQYVHAQGVIHRDVKADNLLLTSRDPDFVCKLADFGLARCVRNLSELQEPDLPMIHVEDDNHERMFANKASAPQDNHQPGTAEPQTGGNKLTSRLRPARQTICGTDETMAPEMQLACDTSSPYTTAVDVFSLGCVFIELCCSQPLGKEGFLDRVPCNYFCFDETEIRDQAISTCPTSFLVLAVQCVAFEPADRLKPFEIADWLEELIAELDNTNSDAP